MPVSRYELETKISKQKFHLYNRKTDMSKHTAVPPGTPGNRFAQLLRKVLGVAKTLATVTNIGFAVKRVVEHVVGGGGFFL